ncbi:MAG: dihydropteroate synthase [Deltaproteobacteria bacterium]|nr:dihydropteroate synthase [Deltaproteobacteria bacterium]
MGWGEPRSKEEKDNARRGDEKGITRRCEIWGVLNVTPDSFSDGGRYFETEPAIRHAREMLAQGADVIDVGGESSRPPGPVYDGGAERVSADEEVRRVVPVIRALTQQLGARVSVDTVKAEVARQAIMAGATLVNDVSCAACSALLSVVAETKAHLVLMHTRGKGEITEQNVYYQDVVKQVIIELMKAVDRAKEAGVDPKRIWIDPGIGFAKTPEQSIQLLACTDELVATGFPVLVGPSRKSFIAKVAPDYGGGRPSPSDRLGGTAAAVAVAVFGGASAVRVHDVRMMRQVVLVAESMRILRNKQKRSSDSRSEGT